MKILIVDDRELLRLLIADQCEALGHATGTYDSADKALESYWEQLCGGAPYDLVITDYQMPRKNGLELCDEIRRRDDLTPIILVTGVAGHELAEVRSKIAVIPLLQLLSKPFTSNQLAEAIERSQH